MSDSKIQCLMGEHAPSRTNYVVTRVLLRRYNNIISMVVQSCTNKNDYFTTTIIISARVYLWEQRVTRLRINMYIYIYIVLVLMTMVMRLETMEEKPSAVFTTTEKKYKQIDGTTIERAMWIVRLSILHRYYIYTLVVLKTRLQWYNFVFCPCRPRCITSRVGF